MSTMCVVGWIEYVRDADGRVEVERRSTGKETYFGWDLLDRPQWRSGGSNTEYWGYDDVGRLHYFGDASGQTSFEYAPGGEMLSKTALIHGTYYTTSWTYGAAGQLAQITYPNWERLAFDYNGIGRLYRVRRGVGDGWQTVIDISPPHEHLAEALKSCR